MVEHLFEDHVAAPQGAQVDMDPRLGSWLSSRMPMLASFPGEVDLYCFAMRAPECLVALLQAGSHSAWFCRVAAIEGRPDLLALAVQHGCLCDPMCLFSAAREGHVAVLHDVLRLGTDFCMEYTHGGTGQWSVRAMAEGAAVEAAINGHRPFLEALTLLRLRRDTLIVRQELLEGAMAGGHVDCLELFQGWGKFLASLVTRLFNAFTCFSCLWSHFF